MNEVLPKDSHFENFELQHEFARIGQKNLHFSGRRIIGSGRRPSLILLAIGEVG